MRTVYLHGRPSHPFHQRLARSLGADFLVKDFLLRWHDHDAPRLKRYASWLLCSLCFPQREFYDLVLTEGPQFVPLLLRRLGLLRPDQRTAAIIAGETPYFLKAGRYRPRSAAALRQALSSYDVLLCVGEMHAMLVREALGTGAGPRLYTIPSGVSEERRRALGAVEPDLGSQQLLFIGNIISPWRAYYKGLDLVREAAGRARARLPRLRLEVVGDLTPEVVATALPAAPWLSLSGPAQDLGPALSRAALYVHLARGEAGPIAALEAMAAGVPTLLSEWTGLRDAAAAVDPRLVVPLDASLAAERVVWYLGLPRSERAALSRRARQVAARYTEARSVRAFRAAVAEATGPRADGFLRRRELVYPDLGGSLPRSNVAGS